MKARRLVRVRMLQTVTHGDVTWPAGAFRLVPAGLADVMVQAGEAERAPLGINGLDTTVVVGITPTRTRDDG